MRANAFTVKDGRFNAQAGYFCRLSRPVESFDLDNAAAGPLRDMPPARLPARLVGIGRRGYSEGHFSLRAGGQAFVMVTDSQRIVYLPSKNGPSL